MIKYSKTIIQAAIIIGLCFPMLLLAAGDSGVYTYLFHLYYDQGKLVKDRDFETAFDLLAESYIKPEEEGDSFSLKIYSIKNDLLGEYEFYILKSGTYEGKVSAIAPFFANATKAIFADFSGKELLSLNLAPAGPLCNDDNVCNSDFGEDSNNCPNDCRAIAAPASGFDFFSPWMIGGGTAVVILIAWFIIRTKRRNQFIPQIQPPSAPLPPPVQ